MEFMFTIFILLIVLIPTLSTIFDSFFYLLNGKPYYRPVVHKVISTLVVIIYPGLFLAMDLDGINDCCVANADFSPEHRLSIYTIFIAWMIAYLVSIFKTAHRLFENKYICDVVYILMKPAEWIFILTIYITDKNPEQRIAFQYLDKKRSDNF